MIGFRLFYLLCITMFKHYVVQRNSLPSLDKFGHGNTFTKVYALMCLLTLCVKCNETFLPKNRLIYIFYYGR